MSLFTQNFFLRNRTKGPQPRCLPQGPHHPKSTPEHLHYETNFLPIQKHLQLHASQVRQKAQYPSHPLSSQHVATRENNKILRTHPPQVISTEENLPRHTRRTLAQLITNKSPFLLSYLHKIDASTHPSPLCPLCRIHEHTTQHLFSCPQNAPRCRPWICGGIPPS